MPRQKGPPPRALPVDENGYFEILTRAVFQAGFSWAVVEAKWPAFTEAFEGFDLEKVAAFGEADVERLAADPGIIRNRRKIQATIENARKLGDLAKTHGSIRAWLGTMADLPWPQRKKKLAAPFRNFGPSSAYYFLWSVGESVPPHSEQSTWDGPVPPGSPDGLKTH